MAQIIYSKEVIKHFKSPHNQGVIKNPTVVGQSGNPLCGDIMKLYIKLDKKKVGG
jgi:nitrogen fixation NifU-like protein